MALTFVFVILLLQQISVSSATELSDDLSLLEISLRTLLSYLNLTPVMDDSEPNDHQYLLSESSTPTDSFTAELSSSVENFITVANETRKFLDDIQNQFDDAFDNSLGLSLTADVSLEDVKHLVTSMNLNQLPPNGYPEANPVQQRIMLIHLGLRRFYVHEREYQYRKMTAKVHDLGNSIVVLVDNLVIIENQSRPTVRKVIEDLLEWALQQKAPFQYTFERQQVLTRIHTEEAFKLAIEKIVSLEYCKPWGPVLSALLREPTSVKMLLDSFDVRDHDSRYMLKLKTQMSKRFAVVVSHFSEMLLKNPDNCTFWTWNRAKGRASRDIAKIPSP